MKGNDDVRMAADISAENQPLICPKFELAFSILGKRWSGLIIRTLANGPLRFSAIEEAIPSLSARMLSERCRELEEAGIIRRQVYPEKPVRIEYELTEKGHELDPALDMIQRWSDKWCSSESATVDVEKQ